MKRTQLRVLRASKGISQYDTAIKARLSHNRYWRIENGYSHPTPDEQQRIARALGSDVDVAFPEAVAS